MRPALSKLSVPLFSPAVSSILVLACLLASSQHQVEAKQVQLPVDIQRSPDPEMMDQQKPGLHSTVYMPPPSAPIINADQQPAVRANRVKRQHVHDNSGFSIRVLIELLFCFFLPPAAVALHGGAHFQLHIVLNVVLCVLGWVPGILHAIWYCFMSGF